MKKATDNSLDSKGSRGWKAAGILFLAGAIVCTAVACAGKETQSQAEDEYDKLAEQTSISVTEEPETAPEVTPEATEEPAEKDPLAVLEEMGVPIPEKTVDFADLQENTNEDIYAWIYIPDTQADNQNTQIDYPVLQHPTDNSYYLNYNLDGSRGYPGCIYTEDYNKKDFSDPVTVLYGHNMKNGTMFAGLHKYGDSEYLEEHPYVYIYTEEGLLVYEIFAAYESGDEHILYAHDGFEDRDVYRKYIKEILDMRTMGSVVKEGVEVTEDSRILTLSTCIAGRPNNRFLVQGVLLNGE